VWDTSPNEIDIAPLRAATAARWFLELAPVAAPPPELFVY
jgi:hypothetical protein